MANSWGRLRLWKTMFTFMVFFLQYEAKIRLSSHAGDFTRSFSVCVVWVFEVSFDSHGSHLPTFNSVVKKFVWYIKGSHQKKLFVSIPMFSTIAFLILNLFSKHKTCWTEKSSSFPEKNWCLPSPNNHHISEWGISEVFERIHLFQKNVLHGRCETRAWLYYFVAFLLKSYMQCGENLFICIVHVIIAG